MLHGVRPDEAVSRPFSRVGVEQAAGIPEGFRSATPERIALGGP